MAPTTRYIVGCMTGTSLDALDTALVGIVGHKLAMRAELLAVTSTPLDAVDAADAANAANPANSANSAATPPLTARLHHLAAGRPALPLDYLQAARDLGELHARAVADLVAHHLPAAGDAKLDFVAAHGQTIHHAPDQHLSWQLFDPWPIVRQLCVPVCYDLRQADLIAGGQGAPITPIADWIMYRQPNTARLIVNLGGICNVTRLPGDGDGDPSSITGSDIHPCNLLLDGLYRALRPGAAPAFDVDGRLAATGQPHEAVDRAIREHPFFAATSLPRSTGREAFSDAWVGELIARFRPKLGDEDLLASAVESIALHLGEIVHDQPVDELILAGGGAHHAALVARIAHHAAGARTILSNEVGIPIEAREAMAFAILGALSQDGVTVTLPQITGAAAPGRAGAWAYP